MKIHSKIPNLLKIVIYVWNNKKMRRKYTRLLTMVVSRW